MPELPEVQTIINYLNESIKNLVIKGIDVRMSKFLKNKTVDDFKKSLINKKIIDIFRKGKYLIFLLSDNSYMVTHLRMEGKFYVDDNLRNRGHDYIVFKLSNDKYLVYNDSRQFGTFHLTNDLNSLKEIIKIAPDPLESSFDNHLFYEKIIKLKRNIKSILMDQSYISGIGNIYASEILFSARISPFRKCSQLSKSDVDNIINSSKEILKHSIESKGTTIHTYKFGQDNEGQYKKYLNVVYRENKNCNICDSKIIRVIQQSRSTFYCPNCQKK